MNEDQSENDFKEQLEKHHVFPGSYTFKFILPALKIGMIKAILPKDVIVLKPSRNGKYVSVTAKMKVESSDDVIRIYKEAANIEDIIKL
ncbi:DUF493 domain-containing protein [Bacteroidota bacterium]